MSRILLTTLLVVLGLASGRLGSTHQPDAATARPNVILIQADDLGWGDLSVYGQKRFTTPALDRMAAEGLRFTQYYSGSTVCAPSRGALLTGRHTGHARIRGNGDIPLEDADVTLAEVLKTVGYRNAVVGKWGLGDADSPGRPDRQGFDVAFGFLRHPHAHRQYTERLWKDGAWIDFDPVKDYVNDLFTEAALAFVDESSRAGAEATPFFLYLAYTSPHAELRAPEEAVAPFRGRFPETSFVNEKADGLRPEPPYSQSAGYRSQAHPRAAFAGMVSRIDRDVGRLLAGCASGRSIAARSCSSRATTVRTVKAAPTRSSSTATGRCAASSGTCYDGGIRVPMIAWWPGTVPQGTREDVWTHWDVLPTIADLAGRPPARGDRRGVDAARAHRRSAGRDGRSDAVPGNSTSGDSSRRRVAGDGRP